jgi:predicted AlkP superfamily pyrophosphatase or phosphodiesterase
MHGMSLPRLPSTLRGAIAATLTAIVTSGGWQPAESAADGPPHVIVISVDGLKPETYTTKSGGPEVPTLRRLAAEGAFARGMVGVFPSVTYPSHTAMITGVPPAVHGIFNNRILDPGDTSNAGWYWYARDIAVPTLPGVVRARGLRAAAVYWPVTVGLDVDFLVPEFGRSRHRESLSLLGALSKPATLLDDVEATNGTPLPWPLTDAARSEIAAWIIRVHRPHLLLLHIFETDDAQHEHGPGSPEATTAIAGADRNVAKVIAAVQDAGLRDRTNIVIVSDHGFLPVRQQLHVNAAFKQEGWFDVDATGRITAWKVYFQPSGGSGFVFLENPRDTAMLTRVKAVLDKVAADPANGVERVLTGEDLRTLGADPRASFAVDMREGFYTGAGHDRLLTPATSKGGHGFLPSRADLHASLILSGPQVPKVGDLGIVRMTQLGPTIASWFGVGLSPKADAPLTFVQSSK